MIPKTFIININKILIFSNKIKKINLILIIIANKIKQRIINKILIMKSNNNQKHIQTIYFELISKKKIKVRMILSKNIKKHKTLNNQMFLIKIQIISKIFNKIH